MKKYFRDLYGNKNTVELFVSSMENGSVSHAYIIEGDRGSGKKLLARCLSCMLAKADGNAYNKIMSSNCIDICEFSVPDKKKFIPVETIRAIKRDAYIKPGELDIRVFIVNDAHLMTVAGQNALLKLLEEPPLGVYFFLLCENAATLLPTVRSRAPIVRMERFSRDDLKKYAQEKKLAFPSETQLASAIEISDGSMGVLIEELEKLSKKEEKEKYSLEAIVDSLAKGNFVEVLNSVLALPAERRQLETALSSLGALFCRMAKEERPRLPIRSLIKLYQCVLDAQNANQLNMNTQILRVTLAKQMMRASR